jgi:putrescine transport system permease protein
MPEVVTGLAFLLLFVVMERLIHIPSNRGMLTISIAHITVTTSYVYLMVQAAFLEMDRLVEEAAMDLGAKPAIVLLSMTLPMIAPSLLGGWLLAFALSLDDVVIASFLSGPGATTLPMLIFSSIRMGVSPEINALATIMIGMMSLIVTVIGLGFYRKNTRLLVGGSA